MATPNPEAFRFLQTRRSRPSKTLTTPVPDRETLMTLLEAGARSPDHGKLEPWRFIVLEKPALNRLSALAVERSIALGHDAAKTEKAKAQFGDADMIVAVVFSPVLSEKVPEVEQLYSAGAVSLSLLNAALATGWGANWITGWLAHDRAFVETGLNLTPRESIAAFMHLGSETAAPPERPRPDIEAITEWQSE